MSLSISLAAYPSQRSSLLLAAWLDLQIRSRPEAAPPTLVPSLKLTLLRLPDDERHYRLPRLDRPIVVDPAHFSLTRRGPDQAFHLLVLRSSELRDLLHRFREAHGFEEEGDPPATLLLARSQRGDRSFALSEPPSFSLVFDRLKLRRG